MQTLVERKASSRQERLHYLDWLRVLAVIGVFYAHCIFIFDTFYWHLEGEQNISRSVLVVFGTEWGMSLFFFLAGAGAWFTLRNVKARHYIDERFKRLLIPFIVGFVLFSPPLAFLAEESHTSSNEGLLRFYPAFFTSISLSWNPQQIGIYSFHLWFLAYLFIISVLALPILFALKREAGRRFLSRLAAWCDGPTRIFLLALPIVLIQVALRAISPGYQSWTDFFTWLLLFIYGFLFLAEPRFRTIVQEQWASTLFVSLASLLILLFASFTSALGQWDSLSGYSASYALYQILRGVAIWSWMAFILSFGMHCLDFADSFITYANEAVLPFYMLHYPIIFVLTFLTFTWHVDIAVKFLLSSTLALLLTLAVFELLIRRVGVLRWLFGMKSVQRASSPT